jgi:RNA recognition motif-containing protein
LAARCKFLAREGALTTFSVQVLLPTRYKSRRPAGYAFVTFKNEADAKKAVETLNETGTLFP